MTTLAANKVRKYENGHTDVLDNLPVITADIIYDGAAVGDSSGYARPLVAGDSFRGFASKKADNSAGANGAITVEVKTTGYVVLSVTGVSGVSDIGSAVYATDDDTFTLTSSGASAIGKICRYVTGTTVVVKFESVTERSV